MDNSIFEPINPIPPSPGLLNQLKRVADNRRNDNVNYKNEPKDIPGRGKWKGYNKKGKATVQLDSGRIVEVKKTFNASIPIDSIVYVDERLVVDGRNISKPVTTESTEYAPLKRIRRAPKPKPIIKTTQAAETVIGRTWLVYEEHLQGLPLTTASGAGVAPLTESTSEIITDLILRGYFTITNSALNLLLLSLTIPGTQIGFYEYYNTDTIPTAGDHPDIPIGYTDDDYNFFCLISGYLQRFYYGGSGFGPEDGVIVGSGSIANVIYSIFSGDYHFAKPYFIRGNSSEYTDKIVALIQHTGDYRVSFGFSRTVGVYPSKRYNINAINWEPVENLNLSNIERRNELPGPSQASTFVIPDSILEWDYDNDFVYEVVPANKPIEHFQTGNTMPDDITKFAAYSGNDLFLNYIIKCYSPFGIDDSLFIRYYPLNLRVNASGTFSYVLGEATFNFPQHYLVKESPDFPMGGGDNQPRDVLIGIRIAGRNDGVVYQPVESFAIVGGPITTGQILFSDIDEADDPNTYLSPVEDLPAGLSVDPYTGYFEFDPSVYQGLSGDAVVVFTIRFDFLGDDQAVEQTEDPPELVITLYGSDYGSSFFPPDPIDPPTPIPPIYVPPLQPDIGLPDYGIFLQQKVLEPPYDDQEQTMEPFEVLILLEQELLNQVYLGSDTTPRQVVSYTETLKPIIRLNGTYYHYESSLGPLIPELTPELQVTPEGLLTGIKVRYAPEDSFNIAFLDEDDTLTISYKLSYQFNYAPYVGNFENLGEYAQRHLRRKLASNAFANDWRSIINPIIQDEEGSHDIDDENIHARDSNITPFNYDPENQIFTTNFGHEIDVNNIIMNNVLSEIQQKVTGNFNYTTLLIPEYSNLEQNNEIGDPGGWRLRFYFVGDDAKNRPLTEAFAQDVLNGALSIKDPINYPDTYFLNSDNNKVYPFTIYDFLFIVQQINIQAIGEKWDARMVPERVNRSDTSGLSWRYDIQNSVWDRAYIFTAWNKPA